MVENEIQIQNTRLTNNRYQPGGSSGFSGTADPLSDASACLRDAIIMQQLGVNTIRVYNLSPTLDHDQCVSIFNAVSVKPRKTLVRITCYEFLC